MIETDPAVVAWRAALAPRPRPEPTGRHWWREYVTELWRLADHAWFLQAEAATMGYPAELAEYREQHPRPVLGDFMRELSHGRADPYELLALNRELVAAP